MGSSPSDPKNLVTFSKSLAKLHKYWARKPAEPVARLIEAFSQAGDVILDPFCGSGAIGLEAILAGRNYIGIDLNPIAVQIAAATTDLSVTTRAVHEAYLDVSASARTGVMDLYRIDAEFLLYQVIGESTVREAVVSDADFRNRRHTEIDANMFPADWGMRTASEFADISFPKPFYKDRFSSRGIDRVADFYTHRALLAIEVISSAIRSSDSPNKQYLTLALSNSLLHLSRLKSRNIRPLSVNNFWLPADPVEENAWWRFEDRVAGVLKAIAAIESRAAAVENAGSAEIRLGSALSLNDFSDASIDHVFTDPPYGDVIQYSELSFIWNAFQSMHYEQLDEVIVNPVQQKTESYFLNQLQSVFTQVHRVLKPNGKLILCFHNRNPHIWVSAANSLRSVGFDLVDIQTYPFLGSSYNKNWATFSPKSDIYVIVRKGASAATTSERKLSLKELAGRLPSHSWMAIGDAYDAFVELTLRAIFDGQRVQVDADFGLKEIVEYVRAR